jgi:hypothetical protein
MKKLEFKTYDNFILKVGKMYDWSGCMEGLFKYHKWQGVKCKVTKIIGDKVFIYDYDDKMEWDFDNKSLRESYVEFSERTNVWSRMMKILKRPSVYDL